MRHHLFVFPLSIVLCVLALLCTQRTATNEEQSATVSASNNTHSRQELFKKYNLDKIKLPPGFTISVFAEVPNARSMCWGERGTLFVGNRDGDKVFAVVDADKNGTAENVYTIASGLNTPCGVAFRKGSLYVAEVGRILRFDDIEAKLTAPPAYNVVMDKLPKDKHHGWKFIAFGPDDKLYVPVGAPCNVCKRDNPVYATITRMDPDGSNFEIFAEGVRNSVGFDWHPQTGALWFTDNGRDNLGDDLPADELNTAPQKGLHFGFPYCHQGDTPDPEFGKQKSCTGFEAPAMKLGAHVAAIGMRFYTGNSFPQQYQNSIFIAQHGSWNRSSPVGYRIMQVQLENGKAAKYTAFATGWLQPDGEVLGRPSDVEIAPDGALLVSDDANGAVYRIAYTK